MAGYGDQGYNQDFYESGYDMDGMQGQQTGWQQHAAAATVPAQAPSQWSGVGQQQGFYQPTSFGVQQGYGQQVPVEYPQHDQSVPGTGWGGRGEGEMGVGGSEPGTLGQMDSGEESYSASAGYSGSFEDEPPLLQELGIDFKLIKQKTLSVLNPMQQTDQRIINDTDLAGPLIFCLLFGVVLLLSGKVQFGYIYGVSFLGCVGMYIVLNLMSSQGVAVSCVVSVLGYCLLPMVLLSCLSIVTSLQGVIGTILSLLIVAWCSYSASKLFVTALDMNSQQLLIAYPCALVYGVFALLTVF